MILALVAFVSALGGGLVGYFFKGSISAEAVKVETATKADLKDWSGRLRSAFVADAQSARAEIGKLITEVESKL